MDSERFCDGVTRILGLGRAPQNINALAQLAAKMAGRHLYVPDPPNGSSYGQRQPPPFLPHAEAMRTAALPSAASHSHAGLGTTMDVEALRAENARLQLKAAGLEEDVMLLIQQKAAALQKGIAAAVVDPAAETAMLRMENAKLRERAAALEDDVVQLVQQKAAALRSKVAAAASAS